MDSYPLPFRAVALLSATALVLLIGILNVRDRARWANPWDGIFWVETDRGLLASDVEAGGPGSEAGIRPGDLLQSVDGAAVATLGQYSDLIFRIGIGGSADYAVLSEGESHSVRLRVGGRGSLQLRDFLRLLLGLVHLAVGLFVMIRGARRPRALHFYLICLASFVVYIYSFTPALATLDWIVYGLSITSFLILPALFVHFCLRFPVDDAQGRSRAPLLYLAAVVLGGVHVLWLSGHLAPLGLPRTARAQELLERIHLVYFCLGFIAGGAALLLRRKLSGDFITRQQMKWVSYGTLAGILPFSLFYGLPWLAGMRENALMLASMLFLGLIPLSFAYGIVRYRLIDVETIMRRGAAYFLASTALLALYMFFVLVLGKALEWAAPDADFLVISLAALAIALLFAPLRNAIQLRLDRSFYKDQFQERVGLLEFARTLSSEISLERLSRNILERIQQTFRVDKAALFLRDAAHPGCYRVADALGMEALLRIAPVLKEEELYESEDEAGATAASLRHAHPLLRKDGIVHLQEVVLRQRRIGIIGLGSLPSARHFSSEDLELLQALANYAAIALDNANLYRSVETKALELERLRDYTENIIESINIAVLALDLDGRVTTCNRAFESLYGAQREGIKGIHVQEILAGDVIASIHNAAGTATWEHRQVTNIYKLYVENRRNERLIVNLSVIPLRDSAVRNAGSLIVMDDITTKVRLEEQLLQVEKLSSLGLLAAGLAHEVNTPITGISSYTQMLLKGMPDSDDRKSILQKIEKQTFRAAEIVNGLLNFARMNGTDLLDVDINQLIQESLNLLEHQLRHGRIHVESDLDPVVPPVYGNAGKLQQVLINLFLNAKDAMPSGGSLRIRTQRNDSMVQVDITDTGVGISEENLRRIFDPFYTTKATGKGTGLGLAITYGIVQEHGGRIFVESVPDRGTRFRVKLPTREALIQ